MERLAEYSDLISLPAMAAFGCAVLLCFQLVSSRWRLEVALAIMVIVLTVGRLTSLGPVADLAKVGSGFTFLLVCIGALQRPGKKLALPTVCWMYLAIAVLAIFFVLHSNDRNYAIAIRIQWLALVVSALATMRAIVNEEALKRVLAALLVGMSISCMISASALIFEPGSSIHDYFGRFMPYGVNPNLIGVLYAETVGLGLYFSLTTKNPAFKGGAMACTALAIGLSLLTLSRGAFLVITLTAMPSSFRAVRSPLFTAVASIFLAVVFYWLLAFIHSLDFDRIETDVTERTPTDVLEEIQLRPIWGLAFTNDLNVYDSSLQAHNAYVSMLYLGGIAICMPLFGLQLYGLYCMTRVWVDRYRLPFDPHLVSVLCGFSLALLVHGFINEVIYHPTYTLAFLNVLIPCFFITMNRCKRSYNASKKLASRARLGERQICHYGWAKKEVPSTAAMRR